MKSTRFKISALFLIVFAFAQSSCGTLNPLTQEHISSALMAQNDAFVKCYEEILKEDRNAKGDVLLKLKFKANETSPFEISVANSEIKNEGMLNCVTAQAAKISIEEVPGAMVEGFYTISFEHK